MDEEEAITRLKRGDLTGLEELVQRYQTRAVHTAYLIVQDAPTAEDVVHGAFLTAYLKIEQFDDARPFGPWFLRSVVNASLKAVNQQRRSIPLEAEVEDGDFQIFEQLADTRPWPEEMVEQAETRKSVQLALEKLTPEQRSAVVMRYYLELSEAEMTNELRRPLSTIKWLLRSAKKRLRKMLNPVEDRIEDPVSGGRKNKEPEE